MSDETTAREQAIKLLCCCPNESREHSRWRCPVAYSPEAIDRVAVALRTRDEEIARLREALEPIAKHDEARDGAIVCGFTLTRDEYRAIRAALAGPEGASHD